MMRLILTIIIATFTVSPGECNFHCGNELNACSGSIGKTAIPWQAYINKTYLIGDRWLKIICNGIIISKKHVLSKKVCFLRHGPMDKISVHVGDGTDYSVKNIDIYEDDIQDRFATKVAIAEIKGEMKFTDKLFAICVPRPWTKFIKQTLYGNIWTHQGHQHLKKGIYKTIKKTSPQCTSDILERLPKKNEKCLTRIEGNLNSNDYGAPFIMKHEEKCTLVGILSKAGTSNTIFMLNLVEKANWIQKIIGE